MLVMVKMVKMENGKKEKYSIIYNIYIFIYYSIKMALPKIDFDQNDHDQHDHMTTQKKKKIGRNRKKIPERFVHRNKIFLLLQRRMIRAPCVPRGTEHLLSGQPEFAFCPARKKHLSEIGKSE